MATGGKVESSLRSLNEELYESTILQLGFIQRIKNRDSNKYTYMHVNSNTIHNVKRWKHPKCPSTSKLIKFVLYTYCEIFLSHKKK